MKKTYKVHTGKGTIEREVSYIPVRYIIAMLITIFEIFAIIGILVALCIFIPYFYILCYITSFACIIHIIASSDNPDYKIPWLLFVLVLPIAGFMLYLIFYSRKLKKKYINRLNELKEFTYKSQCENTFESLKAKDPYAYSQAKMLCSISNSSLFTNTRQEYFPIGEKMWERMLTDLKEAKSFIFLEYFIIEEGEFWNSILEILKEKAKLGVDVRIAYDDIGCMNTLPGNYYKQLMSFGIKATPFSRLRGNADSEFNNRSHRKLCIIDGKIGYTGGINIADEYVNKISPLGHWNDTGIRLEGEAVWEMTRLFMTDFGINVKKLPSTEKLDLYPLQNGIEESGYIVPFGDGPRPIFERNVGKSVIQNMLGVATKYMYITTPYLIIDNELCQSIENASLRGVDVRIIVPHIPDKRLVFSMTRSFYQRLIKANVKIYEYKPGFIHAKSYVADDKYAMIGTINLDYRSLVHHFENGVWMYDCNSIKDIRGDIDSCFEKSILIKQQDLKTGLFTRFLRSLVRIFSPML